jgi:hypothetical protein
MPEQYIAQLRRALSFLYAQNTHTDFEYHFDYRNDYYWPPTLETHVSNGSLVSAGVLRGAISSNYLIRLVNITKTNLAVADLRFPMGTIVSASPGGICIHPNYTIAQPITSVQMINSDSCSIAAPLCLNTFLCNYCVFENRKRIAISVQLPCHGQSTGCITFLEVERQGLRGVIQQHSLLYTLDNDMICINSRIEHQKETYSRLFVYDDVLIEIRHAALMSLGESDIFYYLRRHCECTSVLENPVHHVKLICPDSGMVLGEKVIGIDDLIYILDYRTGDIREMEHPKVG